MAWFYAVIVLACLQSCITLPRRNLEGHFIGEGSNDIATSILKGYEHESSNFVFSPLGYSTILAILAEGAVGKTRSEIVSALKFPADTDIVRGTFKTVLQRMSDKETLNKPEFKTYFYIYKNITVNEDYKRILSENYLTEIKSVDRPDEEGVVEISYESSTETSESVNGEEYTNEEKLKQSTTLYPLLSQESVTEKVLTEDETKLQEKLKAEKEKLEAENEKMKAEMEKMAAEEEKKNAEMEKMKDKTSAEKEKENVEKIKAEMDKMDAEKEKTDAERKKIDAEREQSERILRLAKKFLGINLRQKRASPQELSGISANHLGSKNGRVWRKMKAEMDKMEAERQKMDTEIKEMIAEKKRSARVSRIMSVAKKFMGMRRKRFARAQELSGISANRLGSKNGRDIQSKMIVFNGLYFRGSFVTSFTMNKNQTDGLFYTSEKEKVPAEMMTALGNFHHGELTDLDADAIELPYEGGRYSLLILLPKTRDGLSKLVSDLSGYSLRNLHKQMALQPVSVRLPKFDFRAISKPVSILKKSGISSIFSSDADLSGLSSDEGLFLNELVQLVTIKVEEDSSSTNEFSALNLSSLTTLRSYNPVKFDADHPFLFFLRDSLENIIISAGKIANPSEKYKS